MAGVAPNGMTPAAMSWNDIDIWARLSGRVLHFWECQLLVRLSGLRAGVLIEQRKTTKPDK